MKGDKGGLYKICEFIVDKRKLFILISVILVLFCIVSKNWVNVEYSLESYLPETTETKRGLNLMDEEFNTYGTCSVVLHNITDAQARTVADDISRIEGVFKVDYDNDEAHYNNDNALLSVTFEYNEKDEKCLEAQEKIEEYIEMYDHSLSTSLGNEGARLLEKEMVPIKILVVIIVVVVLLLTSTSYAEVPVLLITFGLAALVQMGTNFFFGTISAISNSVSVVLQLALSVDYAVILLHRYKEERANRLLPREASIVALSKAIPEISGSSLTTVGGLAAMMFMQYGIGSDLGMTLIKAIVLSILSVFTLMPGLLVWFSSAMEKTKHKSFIPEIPFVGKFAYKTRYIIAPAFFVAIIVAYFISAKAPLVYSSSLIKTPLTNDMQKVNNEIKENFGKDNIVAVCVPVVSYEREAELIRELEKYDEVKSITALANSKAIGDYYLTDRLTPRQFAELLNLDYEVAELVYTAYAVNDEDYGKVINGLANYSVPLIDMFDFIYEEVEAGYVTLDDEKMETLESAHKMINYARDQLKGENYSRIVVSLNLPMESDETTAFLDTIHDVAGKYYDEEQVIVVGESVSVIDLNKCFIRDNKVVNIISVLTVLIVLLFTFKSVGMPILLILVIQGSIWINFSVPTIKHDYLFFFAYLIVSSIQMGANIDYAIVIASRYMDLRKTMLRKETVIKTMNQCFPTIITSGTMLAVAGILIGRFTSNAAIYGIGQCIGRGTIISILITMFVLPQILLVGDRIIERTYFSVKVPVASQKKSGLMRINGMVRGHINGVVTGVVNAEVRGDVSAYVESGAITTLNETDSEKNDSHEDSLAGEDTGAGIDED